MSKTVNNPTSAFGLDADSQTTRVSNNLATGLETIDRILADNTAIAVGSGTLRLVYFTAPYTFLTSSVRAATGGTAAAATPTICRYGLYAVSSNGDLTLIASTTNDTSLWSVASTMYPKSWTTAVVLRSGFRYAVSAFCVSGGATPTLAGRQPGGAFSAEFALPPRLASSLTGQSDLPAFIAAASLVDIGAFAYYAFS